MRSNLSVARVEEFQRLGAVAYVFFNVKKAYGCVPVDQRFKIIKIKLPPTVAAMNNFILAPTPVITDKDYCSLWVNVERGLTHGG